MASVPNADPISQWLLGASITAIMQNWSNAYYQYRKDTLDEEQWMPIIRDAAYMSELEFTWAIWDEVEYHFEARVVSRWAAWLLTLAMPLGVPVALMVIYVPHGLVLPYSVTWSLVGLFRTVESIPPP